MKNRAELPAFMKQRGYMLAAEVGVQRGEFSNHILAAWDGRLVMIDAWRNLPGYDDIANVTDELHAQAYLAAIAVSEKYGERAQVVVGLSVDSAKKFDDASIDLVYLDADHSESAVLADLEAWAPKVRNGGVIGGHDFLDGTLPEGAFGVKSAVLGFFGRHPDIVTQEPWPSWFVEVK